MIELILAGVLFCISTGKRYVFRSKPKPYQHPSLKPQQCEIVSRATWDKHDRPFLGPKRKRNAEFYRSRYVSKKVKKLPKSLPF